VDQHRIGVGVGFNEPAPLAIGTEIEFVGEGARFLLGACDHRLRNALEGIQLSLVNCEIDSEVHRLFAHAGILLGV
jgi:hypothetical protein